MVHNDWNQAPESHCARWDTGMIKNYISKCWSLFDQHNQKENVPNLLHPDLSQGWGFSDFSSECNGSFPDPLPVPAASLSVSFPPCLMLFSIPMLFMLFSCYSLFFIALPGFACLICFSVVSLTHRTLGPWGLVSLTSLCVFSSTVTETTQAISND